MVPVIAESWEYGADGTLVTFHLRNGITFHDGTPLDAEAVAFNLRRVIDPKVNAPRASNVADIGDVEVSGPMAVTVRFKETSGAALAGLASEAGMISSPTAIAAFGEDYGRHPVGTGPFKFREWISGSHVTLDAHDGYWGVGADGRPLPYVDDMKIRFITEIAVKMIELQSGNVHLVDTVTADDFAAIESDPALTLIDQPGGVAQFVAMNVRNPPLDNELVRKAFSMAIDREQMMRAVTRGYGSVANGLFYPGEFFYDDSRPAVPHDIARARELLAEAGYPDGLDLELSVIQRDPDTLVAQIIQQQVAEAGIRLNVEILERQAWVEKVLRGGSHQAAMLRTEVPRLDPHLHFGIFYGRNAPQNWSGIDDEEVFGLVEEARRSIDPARRRELYTAAETLLADDRAYYAYLFIRQNKNAARVSLRGLKLDKSGYWYLDEAWLAE